MLGELGGDGAMEGFALGLILAMEVPNLFSAPLPSKFTIATFENEPEHTRFWIRSGEKEAVAQAILLGLGGSLLTHSWWPFVLVMAMVAWKVWSYEHALSGGEHGLRINMASQGGS